MKWMLGWVMVVAACAGSTTEAKRPFGAEMTDEMVGRFLDFVTHHDVDSIEHALHAPLGYGGLWFTDPDCTRQFPVAGYVKQDRLHAFAMCLAGMKMQRSIRSDVLFGVAVVDVEPGFEIEVAFKFLARTAWVRWIGFSGRRGIAQDALPTVQPEVLEANRLEGDLMPSPPPALQQVFDANIAAGKRATEYAWMKICIDANGDVTSTQPREATSAEWLEFVQATIATWKFKPFLVGHQALPVCAHERIVYPRDRTKTEMFPLAYGDNTAKDPILLPPTSLKRISGETMITPDDATKSAFSQLGGGLAIAAFKICLDERGVVKDVVRLEPSGLDSWDERIIRAIHQWRYEPAVVKGKPAAVCTGLTMLYRQN